MKSQTEQTYRHRILRVLLYIQDHLHRDPSLEELAGVANFSAFHFHRIFKAMVGEPVREYVRRLRLESAAVALKLTDRGVTDIAFDAGYETHEAFTRAFKAMFGASPSVFRADHRATLDPSLSPHPEATPMISSIDADSVRIEEFPPRRVVFMRHTGPYPEVGPTFERFLQWAGLQGLFGPDTLVLGVSHDDPDVTPADKLRYDCCMTVGADDALDEQAMAEANVGVQTLEGGPHAVITHEGPYEQLGEVYGWLFGRWLPASGREPRDAPCFEVYLNSPEDTEPAQLLTDIYLPLKA